MSEYFAGGPWAVWYTLLWLALAPFVFLVVWAITQVRASTSERESTWLNGLVVSAFFVMIMTTLVCVVLYVRSQPDRTIWTYLRWLAAHFFGWTFLGSGIFFASLQALGAGPKIATRRIAAFLAFAGATLIHVASLYATWRFRARGG